LAIFLKLFAQFAHLCGYFFKAQIAKTQIAQPWKTSLKAQRKLRNLRTVCVNAQLWLKVILTIYTTTTLS